MRRGGGGGSIDRAIKGDFSGVKRGVRPVIDTFSYYLHKNPSEPPRWTMLLTHFRPASSFIASGACGRQRPTFAAMEILCGECSEPSCGIAWVSTSTPCQRIPTGSTLLQPACTWLATSAPPGSSSTSSCQTAPTLYRPSTLTGDGGAEQISRS